MFLPVIPISVAMTADAAHVWGETTTSSVPDETGASDRDVRSLLSSDGLTDHKKCTVTDITIPGKENINIRLPQFKNIYIGM